MLRSCRYLFVALSLVAGCTQQSLSGGDDLGVPDASTSDAAGGDLLPPAMENVTVDHSAPSTRLDSSFAGFSYEKSAVATPLFSGSNTDLIGLFQRLGPSVLRVGGNSVDKTSWSSTGTGLTAGTIAPADVDRLAAFLKAANWKVIYGINLATNTTANAAAEAAYASTALGDRLLGFEIGNEPDLYAHNGDRPSTYTYPDFRTEWESYATAIRAQLPNAPLTGPAVADSVTGYTVNFAADEASKILLLTQHYYLANGMDPTSTIAKLLMPDPKLTTICSELAAAATKNKIPDGYRFAEANSFYNGGAPNVSDSYASSLWVIDFLFAIAKGGASGVNFHGGGNGPGYTPIANDAKGVVVGPRPEYDGILLFSLAAKGRLISAKASGAANDLSVYAVDEDDGSTAVMLVNKDANQPVTATIDLGKAASAATTTALTGPALDATTGVLVGGAPVGKDGAWTPTMPPATVSGTMTSVDVAPASAVLLLAK